MADVAVSTQKWGRNEFDIPVPSFFDLYAVRSTLVTVGPALINDNDYMEC